MEKIHVHADVVAEYLNDHSVRLSEAQKFLIEKTVKEETRKAMLYSTDQAQFIANLCLSMKVKKTIDIGVYTGYSSLTIAEVLSSDGKLFALDLTDEYLDAYCIPAWEMAGVKDKIHFIKGPAKESLESLLKNEGSESFDFVSIDADKLNYDTYYELSLKLIRPGGIIALDNMLWSNRVLDPNCVEPDTVSLRNLAKKIHGDVRVNVSMFRIGDGLSLVFKK